MRFPTTSVAGFSSVSTTVFCGSSAVSRILFPIRPSFSTTTSTAENRLPIVYVPSPLLVTCIRSPPTVAVTSASEIAVPSGSSTLTVALYSEIPISYEDSSAVMTPSAIPVTPSTENL